MTLIEYANGLNGRILRFLDCKIHHQQMDPFIMRFSLVKEPLAKLLSEPLVIQGETPNEFKHRNEIQLKDYHIQMKKINRDMDILESR